MKRRVRLILDQRSAEDSESILNNISLVFTNDDIDILLHSKEITEDVEIEQRDLEKQAHDEISSALELEASNPCNQKSVNEEKIETKKSKEWISKLSYEGIKSFVVTVAKDVADKIL